MHKYKIHITLVFFLSLYLLTQLIKPFVGTVFIKYYLADLCFIPVLIAASILLTRVIRRESRLLVVKPLYIVIVVVSVSIYFEWYLPNFNKQNVYTADMWDVIMYILGGLLFWIIQRFL